MALGDYDADDYDAYDAALSEYDGTERSLSEAGEDGKRNLQKNETLLEVCIISICFFIYREGAQFLNF